MADKGSAMRSYNLALGPILFKKQRLMLQKLVTSPLLTNEQRNAVDGLIGLTDELADQAHDKYGLDTLLTTEDGQQVTYAGPAWAWGTIWDTIDIDCRSPAFDVKLRHEIVGAREAISEATTIGSNIGEW